MRASVLLGLLVATLVAVRASATPANGRAHAELVTEPDTLRAGEPATFHFTIRDSLGRVVRFLENVHERPMHLIAVSSDLAEFAHIHPQLGDADTYDVTHAFAQGGRYRLFADYTPPGSGTRVDHFDVTVAGTAAAPRPLVEDSILTRTVDGVRVTLAFDRPPRANQDLLLVTTLADSAGAPITDLQLYLGALAHFILVSQDLGTFIHAHPLETGEVFDPSTSPNAAHVHDPALLAKVLVGPSPSTIRAATSFPHAGLYKLWMQFQRHGTVVTVPFVIRVAPAEAMAAAPPHAAPMPPRAIPIAVSSSGYSPARIDVPRGQHAVLAFTRTEAGNCAGTVVIPRLGIRKALPVGQTVLVEFTPDQAADIPFSCAMGM